ncbi:MAG: M1 family aminopeptidase [Planctomycetota bacterium]|nr:M1 family aminopeptidase [Planctomycetota bacterium]
MELDRISLGARVRRDFTMPGAEPSYAPDLALEPTHIRIAVGFDIEAKTAAGTVTTTVRANRNDAKHRTIRFNAISFLDVSVAGPEQWRYDGTSLDVTWDKPFAAGEERTVAVTYRVVEPVSGLYFQTPDDAYPDRLPLMWTDHEAERARYWLPCVDYPTIRTRLDFDLTGPKGMTILANGSLVEAGDGMAKWRLDQPCPSYLCCIAIGAFTTYEDEAADGIPVRYFASSRFTPQQLHNAFGETPAMLRWLQKRLGRPFPYPKYYQVALPGVGGAMENISLVTWDEIFVCDEALDAEWGDYVDAINIHEMAHSYFGDDVVCRHFEHSWLKESWAVYVETAYWQDTVGKDAGDIDLFRNARAYMKEADDRYVRPIVTRTYNTSWDLYDLHLYPGGAWRIHMMRHIVGDDAFWKATTDYLETYSGRVVETADFRQKLEDHSGLNLNRFFDQWIYGKGYPKLKATYKHDAEKNQATITIEQKQVDDKKGIETFAFDLDVAIEDDKGWTTRTLAVDETRHVLVVPTNGKPKQVRFDPGLKVLFRLEFDPGHDMLVMTLNEAEDLVGRIRAAETLIKNGSQKAIAAVREAMAKEPYHGVREAVATALSESPVPGVAETLAEMLLAESDPRAKRGLAAACGTYRDPRLREALRTFLDREGEPPLSRMHALMALGAQRDENDVGRMEAETATEDLHRFVAGGAWRGLGRQRSEHTFGRLLDQLPYGAEDERSRRSLLTALTESAGLQRREDKERAVDALIDLTRDPREEIRIHSVRGLAGLRAGRAANAVDSVKATVSHQDAVDIERQLARLRGGGPGEEVTKLKEQFEKLEERCRKLEQRLQDLEAKDS